ncbi:MAG: sensor histidine kinase [Cryobacterium sp.]
MSAAAEGPIRLRGILAPVARLDRWLDVVLVALVIVCAIRYVSRHGLDASGLFILAGASALILVYAGRRLVGGRSWRPTAWVVVAITLWVALTLIAPSFAWTAVPLAFAALQVLPFPYAAGLVALMTVVVSAGWLRIADGFDPTIVVGPVGIALVTVIAFRALERKSLERQLLLDDLTATQTDLLVAQRHSGALAERARLSREIHDSVAQGLSSINLLLNAAERDWSSRPEVARSHIRLAATTAREGLDEVRRVVQGLAPAGLEDASSEALPAMVRRVVELASLGVPAEVRVHGDPVPMSPTVAGAIIRTLRGALANVVEHAQASRVVVSLTYVDDEVLLDVHDDGRGFTPYRQRSVGDRGRGLSGIRHRVEGLGGRASTESAPNEGTTVSVAIPLADRT